jgi:hypothetical protein
LFLKTNLFRKNRNMESTLSFLCLAEEEGSRYVYLESSWYLICRQRTPLP